MHGGKACYVKTKEGFRINCQSIVVATNTPVNDRLAIHTKQYPYRTYAMAFKIPEGKMQKALYWDTEDPYHYIRLESNDVMIVGGEDHKTGQESYPESCFQRLESWVRSHFSFAGEVLYRWSGQVMEPMDGLGYLGHNPVDFDNVYVITGDSGNGMTHCTIGAMLITDQIMGRKNPWEELYKPSRISLRASTTFLKENLNMAAQYADWVTTESKDSLEDLAYGEGRVFRHGTQYIAAYRNDTGDYQTMTAVCPHLGGIVTWNSVEKSWDCPCHGSRFDCHGKVIEGPALSDLKRVDFEEPALVAERVGFNKIPYSSGEISPV
jgi:Rieske Fe-S protein